MLIMATYIFMKENWLTENKTHFHSFILQTPSMISLRGPEFEERRSSIDRLPPIVQEP